MRKYLSSFAAAAGLVALAFALTVILTVEKRTIQCPCAADGAACPCEPNKFGCPCCEPAIPPDPNPVFVPAIPIPPSDTQ